MRQLPVQPALTQEDYAEAERAADRYAGDTGRTHYVIEYLDTPHYRFIVTDNALPYFGDEAHNPERYELQRESRPVR